LYWSEVEKDWAATLRQHQVEDLTLSEAQQFLAASGIDEEKIRDSIVETVSGVPSDLVLAVDLYEEIKRQNEEPAPEDFGKTPHELYRRFFRYLRDNEMAMLELLSVPRSFDRDIVEELSSKFDPGFSAGQFTRLKRFAFVNQLGEGPEEGGKYSLHERARDAIREHVRFFAEPERVHEFLFQHYSERIEGLEPSDVKPYHEELLREAFYHGSKSMDVKTLSVWFYEESEVFTDSARWQMLGNLHDKLLDIQEENFTRIVLK